MTSTTPHHTTSRATRPLRVLLAWRPNSAADIAHVVAWLARTQPVDVRTATVISRSWSANASRAHGAPTNHATTRYEQWVKEESAACATAAHAALAAAGVPENMLNTEQPCVVLNDHSETSVLIKAAEEYGADLLIVGSHTDAPKGRFRIGSTADALLHCSPIPLLLAPHAPKLSKRGVTRVNCAYVDTEQSHQALRNAADLAARWGVPLRLVAFSPRGATMYPSHVTAEDVDDAWQQEAESLLARGRDRALARHSSLEVSTAAGCGETWGDSVGSLEWKKGDLMVLGSSVLGDFNRVFIGPSTNQIIRHCPAPVLLSTV